MSGNPVQAIEAVGATLPDRLVGLAPKAAPSSSFSQLLMGGLDEVASKVAQADAMVEAFAVDDSIPVHQVAYALEQARLSVELMLQVRGRLVEGYQEFMRMQL